MQNGPGARFQAAGQRCGKLSRAVDKNKLFSEMVRAKELERPKAADPCRAKSGDPSSTQHSGRHRSAQPTGATGGHMAGMAECPPPSRA